ncbi:cyclic nucleotide-gated ion channel 1 [Prunus persica]|uniref:cyclic nucleotide-gated ion channel 1 n=1 Tax=Prunus persica TaxID=3760 RepID=UPI0009AB7108|nr:cyclic nucleotide-gated ion channel 1 [Prunus persica]
MANLELTLAIEEEEDEDEETSLVQDSDEEQVTDRCPPPLTFSNSTTIKSSMLAILCWGCFLAVEIPRVFFRITGVLIVTTVKLICYLIKATIVITIGGIYFLVQRINWRKIFVISCVISVIVDPLFLYIPIINQDLKCIDMDKALNKTAFALRAVADFSYFVDLLVRLKISKTIWQSCILIDILALLPLPQVVIILFFSKAKGWRSLNIAMLMNSLAMVQYVPRILRIYFSCKELKESFNERIGLWIKSVLNFFMYILASHVLGAFWYFFAIQRMKTCWQLACRTEIGCEPHSFVCDDLFRNTTSLNDLCPINPQNETLFDFGIFVDVLKSGISKSTNHPQKFSNCFWWGLRNLSSLGSNLQPSITTWENLFAAFVSIIGLLLFIYLIGNLQMYMQFDAAREEARKERVNQEMKTERRLKEKDREIAFWLSENVNIPQNEKDKVKSQIMRTVKHELEELRGGDVEEILSILPSELQSYLNSHMMWKKLQRVPKLDSLDEQVLKAIWKHSKTLKYAAKTNIIKENEPIDKMFFIIEGVVKIESSRTTDRSSAQLKAGDFFGEELVDWATIAVFPNLLPLSTSSAKATKDVKARVLLASDLCDVVSLFRDHFRKRKRPPPDLAGFNCASAPPPPHRTVSGLTAYRPW